MTIGTEPSSLFSDTSNQSRCDADAANTLFRIGVYQRDAF